MTKLLLASDFDGTLAAIHEQPEAVEIDPEALLFLRSIAARSDVALALISGRDVDDLRRRAGELTAWYSGSHGHEIVAPDGTRVRSATPWKGLPPRALLDRATGARFRLEPKRFGIALHWRGLEGVDESNAVVGGFEAWAKEEGLTVIRGRCVMEASAGGASKEEVLRILLERTGADRLVYAGDDLTDFNALEFAATRGRAFLVVSRERPEPPPAGVEPVHSRQDLLRKLESVLEEIGLDGAADLRRQPL